MSTVVQDKDESYQPPQESESDSESQDDLLEDLPSLSLNNQPSHNRARRTSVSAESMAPTTSNQPFEKIVIFKSHEQTKRIEASIMNNFLFKSLDEEQYTDVIGAMAEKKLSVDEVVIQQGDIGDFFYVVEQGSLDVFVSRDGASAVKVHTYGPGGSFGELALMYNAPRAATIKATTESTIWALDRVTFKRMLMENASKKRRMYEQFLESVPLFVSLEPYERQKIADALESVTFNDGDSVLIQGDLGESFFIIESGEAKVIQKDEHGIDHEFPSIKKGGYFGELALLNNEPRKASIVAIGKLKCATMNKKAFNRLLGPVVDIIKRNAHDYVMIQPLYHSPNRRRLRVCRIYQKSNTKLLVEIH